MIIKIKKYIKNNSVSFDNKIKDSRKNKFRGFRYSYSITKIFKSNCDTLSRSIYKRNRPLHIRSVKAADIICYGYMQKNILYNFHKK